MDENFYSIIYLKKDNGFFYFIFLVEIDKVGKDMFDVF